MRAFRTPRAFWLLVVALAGGIAFSLTLAVSLGSVRIPFDEVWRILAHAAVGDTVPVTWSGAREAIVIGSRLPRCLTAVLVGACLALAGASAQGVTRNPLADPYLLGVSSGAGFGVVLVTILGVGSGMAAHVVLPIAAFLGGLVPLAVALLIGGRFQQPTAVILVGVAVGQVFSALITFCLLVVANEQQLSSVMHWMAGGFGGSRWETVWAPAVALVGVGTVMIASGRRMDLLHTGEDGATALGLNVRRFRLWHLLGVSLLAGVSVSVAGGIGFVGLLVPHLAGFLVGTSARRQLPAAALLGALAMVLADTAARSVTTSLEVPVGVITALVGAPVFLLMLLRQQRRGLS